MSKKIHLYNCDYCNKEFLIDSSTLNKLKSGKQKHCYCSKECKSASQHTGKNVVCDYCGKIFYRRQQHIDRSKLNFCSYECNNEYIKKNSKENRICEICGKEFMVSKSSNQRFCSPKCQSIWQTKQVGELSSHYKKEEYLCDYCHKPFMAQKYKIVEKNNNKRMNIFCSTECRQNWYAEYSKTDKVRNRSRKVMLDVLSSGKISTTNSKPQQIIDNILDKHNINYVREYNIKYYSIDNYLSDYNLMIEVMGDYWHSNPCKFQNDLNDTQKDNLRRDKAKHTYVNKYMHVNILYLWEDDILNHRDLCEKMILEYISKNGVLDNYHSFNFERNPNDYVCIGY